MQCGTTCSVTPWIPPGLVNSADLEIIQSFGLSWQRDESERYHFRSTDYNGVGYLEIDDPREFLQGFEQDYPEGGDHHEWVETLRKLLNAAAERDQPIGLELIDHGITLQMVFQGMLQRDTANSLDDIYMNGAFTGRPISEISEGGFVSRITRSRIDHIDTLDTGKLFEYIEQHGPFD